MKIWKYDDIMGNKKLAVQEKSMTVNVGNLSVAYVAMVLFNNAKQNVGSGKNITLEEAHDQTLNLNNLPDLWNGRPVGAVELNKKEIDLTKYAAENGEDVAKKVAVQLESDNKKAFFESLPRDDFPD